MLLSQDIKTSSLLNQSNVLNKCNTYGSFILENTHTQNTSCKVQTCLTECDFVQKVEEKEYLSRECTTVLYSVRCYGLPRILQDWELCSHFTDKEIEVQKVTKYMSF